MSLLAAEVDHLLHAYESFFGQYIRSAWHRFNKICLQQRLEEPVFAIGDMAGKLGTWHEATRTISLSKQMLLTASQAEIEEVLKHEMAHQFASEILQATGFPGETAHGSAFRYACTALGIEHGARMALEAKPSSILERIRKLLALAESANIHEAEVAMSRARDLMARYELDTGLREQDFFYRFIGSPRALKSSTEQFLALILNRFFNVEIVWIETIMPLTSKRAWLLEANGTAAELDVADYVYQYLVREVAWLWREHRRKHPRLKGRGPKMEFQVGVLQGLIDKLNKEKRRPAGHAGELVLLKKEKLRAFLRDRHPRLYSGGRMTYRKTDTYQAGFDKGRDMEIRKGVDGKEDKRSRLGGTLRLEAGD